MKFLILICALFSFELTASTTSPKCLDEAGEVWINFRHRNPTEGGFVGHGTHVEESVFVAKSAAVCGSASVEGKVRIYGNSIVKDNARVEGNAKIFGNAVIKNNASVEGNAKVYEDAVVGGDTVLMGDVQVKGETVLSDGVYSEGILNEGRNEINELVTELKNKYDGKKYTYSDTSDEKEVSYTNYDFSLWGNRCIARITHTIETYKLDTGLSQFQLYMKHVQVVNKVSFTGDFQAPTHNNGADLYTVRISPEGDRKIELFEYFYDGRNNDLYHQRNRQSQHLEGVAKGASLDEVNNYSLLLILLKLECKKLVNL